ncbi:MAG: hypothetical protein F4X64_03165 [Chloroflexi bacterium]|nr:hypothetical protein [Chloroflexota bacterium]
MSGSEKKNDRPADSPLTDEEFDAWWPFSDDDLDEYEREIVKSLRNYEWVPPSHLDEERRKARARVRSILAMKQPNGLPDGKAHDTDSLRQHDISTAADLDS